MIFNSVDVIKRHISEADFRTYFVGFDLGEYMNEPFTELIMDTIVDFAFGYHTGILKTYDRRRLKEAARSIYNIKEFSEVKWVYVDSDSELSDCEIKSEQKYLKRGEFGEMILHLLLRDFFDTTPLLSKFHFKDSDSCTVHGFDIVHIGPDLNDPSLDSIYLGESKLYSRKDGKAGNHGISDLIEDIKEHFKKDFLYREIALIAKKKDAFKPIDEYEDKNTVEEYEKFLERKRYWFNILEQVQQKRHKLQDFFKSVTVPLVCTYQSSIFDGCNDDSTEEFKSKFESEVRALKKDFTEKLKNIQDEVGEPVKTNLNIVLLLFPIPSKKQLIKVLHEKLYKEQ